jgi:hypothetical protein
LLPKSPFAQIDSVSVLTQEKVARQSVKWTSIHGLIRFIPDQSDLLFIGITFIISRLVLILATWLMGYMPSIYGSDMSASLSAPFWHTWYRWDTLHYVNIAIKGYSYPEQAFFPLYPLLIRISSAKTYVDTYLAGMFITNLFWLIASYLVYLLVKRTFNVIVARMTIIAYTAYPTAFFFFVPYPHAIFIALYVGMLLCFQDRRWWLAGLLGMFASACRQTGILLVIPFLWEYVHIYGTHWRSWNKNIIAILLIPCGVLFYTIWLWYTSGNPIAFMQVESYWSRLTIPFPVALIWGFLHFFTPHNFFSLLRTTQELAMAWGMIFLAIKAWKSPTFPKGWTITSVVFIIFFLSHPQRDFPLMSQSRYDLEAVPLFIMLGSILNDNRRILILFLVIAIPLQLFFIGVFARGGWII